MLMNHGTYSFQGLEGAHNIHFLASTSVFNLFTKVIKVRLIASLAYVIGLQIKLISLLKVC